MNPEKDTLGEEAYNAEVQACIDEENERRAKFIGRISVPVENLRGLYE